MKNEMSFHELSLREQAARLQPVVLKIQKENLERGLYNIYKAPRAKDLYIHDYRDRVEQVRVDAVTGQTRVVRRKLKK
ncbi:MAG: hypothetical protein ACHQHN_18730 [Sphingobacteriales bacterium]